MLGLGMGMGIMLKRWETGRCCRKSPWRGSDGICDLLVWMRIKLMITGLYTDESPGLKVDPVVVLVLSLVFIFSVVALHSMSFPSPHNSSFYPFLD